MNFKNIAISGDTGTGKTTLAKKLAKKLGWQHLSTGEYFRKWHGEHGIPLEKTGEIPEEVDKEIDFGYQTKMQDEEHIIFESRLSGWLSKNFPFVFRIICITDFEVAMERVSKRDRISIEEAKEKSQERSKALQEKFENLYGVKNFLDPEYFNLVVDTTNMDPLETLEFVLDALPPEAP
ncbi:hypothetical protein A3F00_00550 [Candidatus Daviesbacteria bacterium RIFCSPHIGHO2_12_FULL_37_11]|uniref:(d)CMP kinase n=1 Tax=Candidatus Daviesbacteria bacterium RIFCSPHIGHO2_12_FULL_37_11 TaxID=1797777 RepID=A0A1F5KDN6_9BACT|nr:MAG: hypothetical protein A2111_03465 [Candidatus Daviesbacteria bacterium GWA1_38_6]OGE38910.1 MAG: hypothetical protein A3F00_00550 [Candidatus Daviesbacteria bacterium RIFCSPHIGHO2_12_FULL_37_11]OGE44815.1 MAG: hypothetical protein A3B39_00160 [Candidatus Daviesbacteria bacterium RIFCSPLOWO2_01_FULL_37_10]